MTEVFDHFNLMAVFKLYSWLVSEQCSMITFAQLSSQSSLNDIFSFIYYNLVVFNYFCCLTVCVIYSFIYFVSRFLSILFSLFWWVWIWLWISSFFRKIVFSTSNYNFIYYNLLDLYCIYYG